MILGIAATLVLGVVALAASACTLYSRADVNTVGDVSFENELAIPPLLEPREEDGRKIFDLALQQGRTELLPGKPAETWGVNGAHLGPTLRAERGDRVELRVRNDLPETTTVHWHGMHLPAVADGGPHQTIEAGETWTPSWRIDQPAATLWYHPHPHGDTADHVYRGVAGLFIVDDPGASSLPLPDDYGVDDLPVIIQDKRLDDNGELDFSQGLISPTGRLGDTILVNGTHGPYVEIGDERVRFRLLNGSSARIYNIGFADNREFDLIATEGGLLETPHRMARIQLSPGERAEIVAAFQPGERIVLRSYEPELETNFWETRFAGGNDSFDLVEIRATAVLAASEEVPASLAAREALNPEDAERTRSFELSGQSRLNGRKTDMSRIDEVVRPGATEIWEVQNAAGTPHNFHVHGVSFTVLEYAGGEPPAHLLGLKDTVYVPPNKTVRLLIRFPDYPDSESPYMFHCHMLQHEDRGMMGQFVLAEAGQESARTLRRTLTPNTDARPSPAGEHTGEPPLKILQTGGS
ncbi:MAG TPA: multicopper oxidase domain-containing protein [Gaiellaceae bacterium]|nr:multicopper oxidase domain-containing protein [Gaiellaceae bacterium]